MSIPTDLDRKLALIDAMAGGISTQLRILGGKSGDDGRQLRERLQAFANEVVAMANLIIANREPVDEENA